MENKIISSVFVNAIDVVLFFTFGKYTVSNKIKFEVTEDLVWKKNNNRYSREIEFRVKGLGDYSGLGCKLQTSRHEVNNNLESIFKEIRDLLTFQYATLNNCNYNPHVEKFFRKTDKEFKLKPLHPMSNVVTHEPRR